MLNKTEFKLRSLLSPLHLWLVAWGLAVAVAVSVLGLLTVSGYFLAVAGAAISVNYGAINYGMISGLIRNFALMRTVGRYGDLLVSHYAIFGLLQKLRVQFFDRFAQLPISERLSIGSATAQYRLVKDIDTLNEFPLRVVSPFVVVGAALLLAGCVLLMMVDLPPIWVVLVMAVVVFFVRAARHFVQKSGELHETRQTTLLHTLPALTQLSLWGKWQSVADEMGKLDGELAAIQKNQSFYNTLGSFLVQAILIIVLLMTLWIGSKQLVSAEGVTVYVLLALVFGLFGLMEVVTGLTADVSSFAKSDLAKDRLNALVGGQITQKLLPMPNNFNIKINNVSAYQTGAVFGLDNVNVRIEQGVPFVITGASGGGKSTLLQTLAGELLPKVGEIVLETTDTKINGDTFPMNGIDWQGNLGFLGQQVDIFDQTLADNLRLGRQGASDEELWAVLELVGLKAWASEQPQGLNTPLGEYGVAVSGGQARRIALARLLLSPKKVLLLDEPFAGLDTKSRENLWMVLKQRQQDGILVVVSHHDLNDDKASVLTIGEPTLLG